MEAQGHFLIVCPSRLQYLIFDAIVWHWRCVKYWVRPQRSGFCGLKTPQTQLNITLLPDELQNQCLDCSNVQVGGSYHNNVHRNARTWGFPVKHWTATRWSWNNLTVKWNIYNFSRSASAKVCGCLCVCIETTPFWDLYLLIQMGFFSTPELFQQSVGIRLCSSNRLWAVQKLFRYECLMDVFFDTLKKKMVYFMFTLRTFMGFLLTVD